MAKLRLTAESTKLVSELKKAQKELKVLKNEYKANSSTADTLSRAEDKLIVKIQSANTMIMACNPILNKYNSAITNAKSELREMRDQESQLTKELENAKNATNRNEEEIKKLETELKNVRVLINNTESALLTMRDGLAKVEIATNDAQSDMLKFKDELSDLNNVVEEVEEEFEELEEVLEDVDDGLEEVGEFDAVALQNALSKVADMMREFGEIIDGITNKFEDLIKNGINATADALVNLGQFSLDKGIGFEKTMSSVAAVMGISTDTEDFKMLEEAAKYYGQTTRFTTTQAAEALKYLAQAGYKAQEAIKMLPSVLNLATAGDIELAQATSYLVDSISALGPTVANDVDGFIDKMAKAATEANTSVELMFQSVLDIGTLGRDLSLDELIATLATLSDYYLKGSEGGTKLRNIMLSLQNPTAEAAELLEANNLSIYDANGEMKSLVRIFTEFDALLANSSQKDKNTFFNTLFNKRDVAAAKALGIEVEGLAEYALGLTDNIDGLDDSLVELIITLSNSDGAAKKMADTMNNNLDAALLALSSAVEAFGLLIYDKIKPGIREAVDNVTEFIRELTNAADKNGITEALDKISESFSNFAKKIPSLLKKHTPTIISIFESIAEILALLLDYLPTLIDSVLPSLLEFIDNILSKLPTFLNSVMPTLISGISWIIGNLPILMGILYGLQGLSGIFAGILDFAGMAVGLSFLSSAAGTSFAAIASAAGPVLAVIGAIMAAIGVLIGIFTTATATSEEFRGYVGTIADSIKEEVSIAIKDIEDALIRLWNVFGLEAEDIEDILNDIVKAINIVATIVAFVIEQILIKIIQLKVNVINLVVDLIELIKSFIDGLLSFFTFNMDNIAASWSNFGNKLINTFTRTFNDAREQVGRFGEDFGDFLSGIQKVASENPVKFKITSEVDTKKFEQDLRMIAMLDGYKYDPNKYNAIALLTNNGKGSSSSNSSSKVDLQNYINDVSKGITNATAVINNTKNNKVTSSTTNKNITQNINVNSDKPIDENEIIKLSRDLSKSTTFTAPLVG